MHNLITAIRYRAITVQIQIALDLALAIRATSYIYIYIYKLKRNEFHSLKRGESEMAVPVRHILDPFPGFQLVASQLLAETVLRPYPRHARR